MSYLPCGYCFDKGAIGRQCYGCGLEAEQARIRTYTGRRVDVLNMQPDDIDIRDIAHALSLNNRFNGHTKHAYSVAQHCFQGSFMVGERLALAFLLHDASEAYIADIVSPFKRLQAMDYYRGVEGRLEEAIFDRFGVWEHRVPGYTEALKEVDTRMLATEQRDLMNGSDTEGKRPYDFCVSGPWTAEYIEALYLARFGLLYKGD